LEEGERKTKKGGEKEITVFTGTLIHNMIALIYFLSGITSSFSLPPTACDGLIRVGEGGDFVDSCERIRIWHGLNVVQKSYPYIPTSIYTKDGSSLSPEDALLWASLGFNVVRLGVMWAGAVPTKRGEVNITYLSSLAALSQLLYDKQGIYTFLDAHQDGFSEWFCDDGAPVWAAKEYSVGATAAFPEPLARPINSTTSCSTLSNIPWSELYLTYAVGKAFQTLYASPQGQKDFGDFWGEVVKSFRGNTGVLGWELLNEPWAGDVLSDPLRILPGVADATILQPFYMNVTKALRAAEASVGAPSRIIFSEPVTWDNFFPVGFSELPGGAGSRGLSYHYYSLPDIVGYALQVASRAKDASRLAGGGILSEFDVGLQSPVNSPYSVLDMRGTMDAVDSVKHSWIGWAAESIWLGNATLYLPNIRELARPYPRAIAGTNASFSFTVEKDSMRQGFFTLSYDLDAGISLGPTEIFVSTGLWWSKADISVSCSPKGSLLWEWEWVDGQVILPGDLNNATSVLPLPFAHAFLRATPAPGIYGRVSITVSAS